MRIDRGRAPSARTIRIGPQEGQILLLTALSLALVAGLLLAATHLGLVLMLQAQHRTAADAAALAGATVQAMVRETIAFIQSAIFVLEYSVFLGRLLGHSARAASAILALTGIGSFMAGPLAVVHHALSAATQAAEALRASAVPVLLRTLDFLEVAGPLYALAQALAVGSANLAGLRLVPYVGLPRSLPSLRRVGVEFEVLDQEARQQLEALRDAVQRFLERAFPGLGRVDWSAQLVDQLGTFEATDRLRAELRTRPPDPAAVAEARGHIELACRRIMAIAQALGQAKAEAAPHVARLRGMGLITPETVFWEDIGGLAGLLGPASQACPLMASGEPEAIRGHMTAWQREVRQQVEAFAGQLEAIQRQALTTARGAVRQRLPAGDRRARDRARAGLDTWGLERTLVFSLAGPELAGQVGSLTRFQQQQLLMAHAVVLDAEESLFGRSEAGLLEATVGDLLGAGRASGFLAHLLDRVMHWLLTGAGDPRQFLRQSLLKLRPGSGLPAYLGPYVDRPLVQATDFLIDFVFGDLVLTPPVATRKLPALESVRSGLLVVAAGAARQPGPPSSAAMVRDRLARLGDQAGPPQAGSPGPTGDGSKPVLPTLFRRLALQRLWAAAHGATGGLEAASHDLRRLLDLLPRAAQPRELYVLP